MLCFRSGGCVMIATYRKKWQDVHFASICRHCYVKSSESKYKRWHEWMSLEKMVIKRNTNIMSGSGKKLILNLISLSLEYLWTGYYFLLLRSLHFLSWADLKIGNAENQKLLISRRWIRYSFIHDGQRSVFHTEFGSLISLAAHTEPWHRVQWELKAYSVSSEETLPCCVRYFKCPEVFLYQPVHAVHQSWVRKVYRDENGIRFSPCKCRNHFVTWGSLHTGN